MSKSETKFWVYFLQCADGTYYCGWSVNLAARLISHNKGKASKYTRARLPVQIVYFEECNSKSAALKRELVLKKLSRKSKEELIFFHLNQHQQATDNHAKDCT